ncbi:hypothetical protein [Stackebrandtia soli]|uniref:hypothetical protein n=1 Tax=Stackebrandtia soli TaxID=1892856 RepID=UPI0039ED4FB6
MHFHVLVALPALDNMMDRLGEALAPFDETTEVAPYRNYETGDPSGHWFVTAARRDRDHLRDGTGLKTYVPGYLGWSSHDSGKTHKEQREGFAASAAWAERLGEAPTWADVVRLHTERYPDEVQMHYDPDTDRAYAVSTYNPRSKWDYWGLRAQQVHFGLRDGTGRVDAGLLADLDIDGMRHTVVAAAEDRYQHWLSLRATCAPLTPWDEYASRVVSGEMAWLDARREYTDQLIFRAQRDAYPDHSPVEEVDVDEVGYVERYRAAAVTTSSTLTLDGAWMDSADYPDRYAYDVDANAYIDSLPPTAALALVTYHI